MENRWYWRLVILVVVATVGFGAACNEHGLNPFDSTVKSGAVEKTEQADVRPVDILFVVDNSNSMCEEQTILVQNFNAFIDILVDANADFRLAVVNSDLTTFVEEDGGTTFPGVFRSRPGTYTKNISSCSIDPPDFTALGCENPDGTLRTVGPILSRDDYDLTTPEGLASLRTDFSCIALTGIDGDGVEMGLGAALAALDPPSEFRSTVNTLAPGQLEFLRDEAFLSIVFLTDENDCTDGQAGGDDDRTHFEEASGNLHQSASASGDAQCEYNRSIEDSCLMSATNMNTEVTLDVDGVEMTKTLFEWCVFGDRGIVNDLEGNGLETKCQPETGCTNQTTSRKYIYDQIVALKTREDAEGNTIGGAEDIIVAAIINRDGGVRYNTVEDVTKWCGEGQPGPGNSQGYRYDLFVQMFPEERQVLAPICELEDQATLGDPLNFADSLQTIAETIGRAINSICLESPPAVCNANGPAEGSSCAAGALCCPINQICEEQIYFEGSAFAYRLCDRFTVRVSVEDSAGVLTSLVESVTPGDGGDYLVNVDSARCITETGSPMEIQFLNPPSMGQTIIVEYPRSLGTLVDE